MAEQNFFKTRYKGVFYRLSKKTDRRTGEPDKIYYVSYTDVLGIPHWKSVGRHSEGMRPQIAEKKRMDLCHSDMIVRSERKRAYTIGDAVDSYVRYATQAGKYISTPYGQYKIHCMKAIHKTPIDQFSAQKAEALKNLLFSHGLSAQSVFHALNFLKRCINYAIATGNASYNSLSCKNSIFRMPKVDNQRLRYLSPKEAKKLLDELKIRSPQLYQMAFLSLHTGLRATEIFRLRPEDIDEKSGCLFILGKGGNREVAPARKDVFDMLATVPRTGSPWLFPDKYGKRHTHVPSTFSRVVEDLGLQAEMGSPYRINFHTLRHTFASWLAQSGKVSLLELKTLMRHKSFSMTQRYAHLIPSEVNRKIELIQNIIKSVDRHESHGESDPHHSLDKE